jgi:hypothetical protein
LKKKEGETGWRNFFKGRGVDPLFLDLLFFSLLKGATTSHDHPQRTTGWQ